MLGPSRPLPQVGVRAQIKHFGGSSEPATVVSVDDNGRRVRVRTLKGMARNGGPPGTGDGQAGCSDGELYEFVLSAANARFVSAGDAQGPRLELLG